jgi:hypothetical protein
LYAMPRKMSTVVVSFRTVLPAAKGCPAHCLPRSLRQKPDRRIGVVVSLSSSCPRAVCILSLSCRLLIALMSISYRLHYLSHRQRSTRIACAAGNGKSSAFPHEPPCMRITVPPRSRASDARMRALPETPSHRRSRPVRTRPGRARLRREHAAPLRRRAAP